jgi:H2-forming N5,N10-methylenetetrahydromethanopterin dehydrogenase-like enzyme
MKKNVLKWVGRIGATLLTTIVILVAGLYCVMAMLAWGPSKVAKKQFIMSLQETESLALWQTGSVRRRRLTRLKKKIL